ncbi:MAG: L-glutamate gamma-semialdehyde dehydrogenase [Bryobacteraceae bacterium]|nr:L-glutamate gamma-semialdehyde dehydrogenase [Bryobacteraceae bacterium]
MLPPFRNEPYADFRLPEHDAAMRRALAQVRGELGREYPILIVGERLTTPDKHTSTNPSHAAEVVGVHQKATAAMASRAIEAAHAGFPAWAATPATDRVRMTVACARLIRERKNEFNAWLVLEAGKNWNEAEADTAEAIDFCEYYARQMERLASPAELVQMPGERGELRYLGLGVGVIIPPWNFPFAILVGMTIAALVTGNTVVIKPSSETPTIGAKFVELLAEAGFPASTYAFVPGSGAVIGDLLVEHPLTRFVSFTGSREVGLRINALAAQTKPGQKWIKRVVAEMGGKDAIIVDADADLEAAAQGVVAAAFGYQGQKCSACSRVIVDASIHDSFVEKIRARTEALTMGPAEDPAYFMGPVISAGAKRTIEAYLEIGRAEGQLVTGGGSAPGEGHYLRPTIFQGIERHHRLFQEEIFGPVLAVTRARDFDHALALANDSDYGLTGAIYSQTPAHLERARNEFFVGNLYLNRKCTGAMVGAHPFGGFNMSGTDSKAGGPDYLLQFLQAKTIAEKVTAEKAS